MNTTTVTNYTDKAREIGTDHGTNAGSWVPVEANPQWWIDGIDDGDPEVLDAIPGAPLSGEWADGYTIRELVEDVGASDDGLDGDDYSDAICTAYEEAYSEAVVATVERRARYHADPDA